MRRSCSFACYKPHKAGHEAEATTHVVDEQAGPPKQDRPGTTQRVPKVDFTGFEEDEAFQRLLFRFPSLKLQLGALYGLTLEPGPDDARTWNRQPLPGYVPPNAPSYRSRGRGRGRGGRDSRGSRADVVDWRDEREKGVWTREKGEKEAMHVMKTMREGQGSDAQDGENAEGMREFIALCRLRFGQRAGGE